MCALYSVFVIHNKSHSYVRIRGYIYEKQGNLLVNLPVGYGNNIYTKTQYDVTYTILSNKYSSLHYCTTSQALTEIGVKGFIILHKEL